MLNILLLTIGLGVYIVYSSSQTAVKDSHGGVNVKELGKYLVALDLKIMRCLILPESKGGDQCLENMKMFWKNFRYLHGLVVLNEQDAFRPAKYVLEKECPKFIHQIFDVYNLEKVYNWGFKELSQFNDNLLSIAGLAQRFQDDFSKMRVDVETLFEQPLLEEK